jgi:hypothetical protein
MRLVILATPLVVVAATWGLLMRRIRRARISDPEWKRRWALVSRSDRRAISRSVRRGEVQTDPLRAYLAAGVAAGLQRLRSQMRLPQGLHVCMAAAAAAVGLLAHRWASAAVLLVGTLLTILHQRYRLPRLRAAIDRAYTENRRVAERAGLTPPDDGTSPAR